MQAASLTAHAFLITHASRTPHYNSTAVTVGSIVFLSLLAAVALAAKSGGRRNQRRPRTTRRRR